MDFKEEGFIVPVSIFLLTLIFPCRFNQKVPNLWAVAHYRAVAAWAVHTRTCMLTPILMPPLPQWTHHSGIAMNFVQVAAVLQVAGGPQPKPHTGVCVCVWPDPRASSSIAVNLAVVPPQASHMLAACTFTLAHVRHLPVPLPPGRQPQKGLGTPGLNHNSPHSQPAGLMEMMVEYDLNSKGRDWRKLEWNVPFHPI